MSGEKSAGISCVNASLLESQESVLGLTHDGHASQSLSYWNAL
jgi:hypothetical protein